MGSHARQCRQRGGELCQREATRVSQARTGARWCSSRRESPMMWMASSPTARSDDATFPAETRDTQTVQVVKCGLLTDFKTTVDEHGKFSYYSSDMRPVPPGECIAVLLNTLKCAGRLVRS